MISRVDSRTDLLSICDIINDAANAYKGIIPADRWKEPYMPVDELSNQIHDGIEFWKYTENDHMLGIMGIQNKGEVTLIRHAYVRTSAQRKGIGKKLLQHLCAMATSPVLIGTWVDATWAIDFYRKQGFSLVDDLEKTRLLTKYWSIPDRQVETSVVLTNKP